MICENCFYLPSLTILKIFISLYFAHSFIQQIFIDASHCLKYLEYGGEEEQLSFLNRAYKVEVNKSIPN